MGTDAELVIRSREGDLQAFDALVRRHYKTALRAAYRYAATPEDADDLTQEAFIAACERLHQLAHPERFAGWLVTIVRNEGRMWHRRRYTQPALLSLDDEPHIEPPRHNAIREAVRDAFSALTAEQHAAVRLHYLDGYDYRETAFILDIPVAAVRGRLDRARTTLRKELRDMVRPQSGWELNARDLDAIRAGAVHAYAQDDKPVLNALYINGEGELVSSDTHRLFHYASDSLRDVPQVLIDADLGRGLPADARHASLLLNGEKAVLRLDDGHEVRAPLVPEAYPNWRAILKESWVVRCSANAGDWFSALEMIARSRGDSAQPHMFITAMPDQGKVLLHQCGVPEDGGISWEATASFAAEFSAGGQELTIAANPAYVEQAVRALGDDLVEFGGNIPLDRFLVRAARGNPYVIIMPMQPDYQRG